MAFARDRYDRAVLLCCNLCTYRQSEMTRHAAALVDSIHSYTNSSSFYFLPIGIQRSARSSSLLEGDTRMRTEVPCLASYLCYSCRFMAWVLLVKNIIPAISFASEKEISYSYSSTTRELYNTYVQEQIEFKDTISKVDIEDKML